MDEGPSCDSVRSGSKLFLAGAPAFVGGAWRQDPGEFGELAESPGQFPMDKAHC
jgi:hypothetical protein